MCPTCGRTMQITGENAMTVPNRPMRDGFASAKGTWFRGTEPGAPLEDAKRKFGEAVDLYYSRRYAESLAIFDDLTRRYPGNADIENGRKECLSALRRPSPLALEHRQGAADGAQLDEETVKRIVLEKLLYGAETVQLQAAELAARILGMTAPLGDLRNAELALRMQGAASPSREEGPSTAAPATGGEGTPSAGGESERANGGQDTSETPSVPEGGAARTGSKGT